ncbi:MAG: valine--tRNA ligase [Parcubacteria group bacterium]
MNNKFLKPYNPQETEGRIYKLWEESGYFNPDNLPERHQEPYTIIMPPPNVTGVLHMGHALMLTLEDVMIRYKRMRGMKTLWLPGTDHAAIATQSKVEKDIQKKEGVSRHDLGREEFLRRVEKFAQDSHDTITTQVRVMGASCDWSREAFTLDEKRHKAVNTMFKEMYEDGLIYRGSRIVNWDPKGQTVISDDELVYEEEKTKFYYLKYGPFTIATARPETKFGDKYVVMHPDDQRYAEYKHGDKIDLEWINGPITATIIKDEVIDMEFGTGVMTITPWHDATDFDIADRHGLEKEQIIDQYGKLLPIAGEFAGQKIHMAREAIVEKLRSKGLVEKEEDYTHNIATAERTGGKVEPQIMRQWFVDVNKPVEKRGGKTLKELMGEPVADGKIKIIPEHFNKTYFHWIDNLRDWCISRQIWYGHRVPVWYRSTDAHDKQEEEMYVGIEEPEGEGWEQDPDTLDTWFSSGLWTFSTLGWPEKTTDLETYHPTDVLETGYEILFFWIARMILSSQYALGEVPFRTVYLHGTVRDQKGRKMSKSLDNGIDPLDVAREFGADAGRMSLVVGNAPGMDTRIWPEKVKAYKHFANKLWNITRYILSQGYKVNKDDKLNKELQKEFDTLARDITQDMENYRFHLASEKIYHYVWHRFADEILEESKKDPSLLPTTYYLLQNSLKLLHPFMPFVTEEIWSELKSDSDSGRSNLLMVEPWPLDQAKDQPKT